MLVLLHCNFNLKSKFGYFVYEYVTDVCLKKTNTSASIIHLKLDIKFEITSIKRLSNLFVIIDNIKKLQILTAMLTAISCKFLETELLVCFQLFLNRI